MTPAILVIEDEPALGEMLKLALTRAGYEARLAGDAREARAALAEHFPDLIVLDWMLPGVSGIEFAQHLKKDAATHDLPIIMLTARGEEADKIRALDSGVDDYITKPFSPRELVARIKAVLRRSAPHALEQRISIAGLSLDQTNHRVTASGEALEMGPTEFKLLYFFMTHPNRVYSRSQLLDRVWGSGVYIEERTVDVHIRRLRKALQKHGYDRMVQTIRSAGYRFSVDG